MFRVLGGIGFVMLMLGAAGMDSENMLIPAAMAISGALLLLLSSRMMEDFEHKNSPHDIGGNEEY